MKRLEEQDLLNRIAENGPCLAAVFTSFSFDPRFFEDHVLRAALAIDRDPEEQPLEYADAARRSLQERPVVVIVDAHQRQPGRRLPYDLLDVRRAVFHPKSALLVFDTGARLLIGSGNLTKHGFGGNAELFFSVDLDYHDAKDSWLLRAFIAHLERARAFAGPAGTQLPAALDVLRRRLPPESLPQPTGPHRVALLDSTIGAIADQLLELLPEDATIDSVGLLAPFYERDEIDANDGADSVFAAFDSRLSRSATLDVGVRWDNPLLRSIAPSSLGDATPERLWSWRYEDDEGDQVVEHLTMGKVTANNIQYVDAAGKSVRWPIADAVTAAGDGTLWPQPDPQVFAPRYAIDAARDRFANVRLWLHPATRLVAGQPVHRPLHAKLLTLSFSSPEGDGSRVMLGSPNMSRTALLLPAGAGGNVELAVAFRLDRHSRLRDFAPELVFVPSRAVTLVEREFIANEINYAIAIDSAMYDPAERTLRVIWSEAADELTNWRIEYIGKTCASSPTPPVQPLLIEEFDLKPSSAELTLSVAGVPYAVPILVTDLVALPSLGGGTAPELDELLQLLGKRTGIERIAHLIERRTLQAELGSPLEDAFGERFTPTDVFRAWWGVAADVADDRLSAQGLRLRLEGRLGARAAWDAIRGEAEAGGLPREIAWFFGAELRRELSAARPPLGPDHDAKLQLVDAFCSVIDNNLAEHRPDGALRPWLVPVLTFFEKEKA